MDDEAWACGAGPLHGIGPREGLPPGVRWPSRLGDPDGPTDRQTRSGAYRHVGPGLWVPADIDPTPEQRTVEAAAQLPAHGGVTGWASLRWWGASWFTGSAPGHDPRPATLALGVRHSKRRNRWVEISQELVPPVDLVRHRGLRVTSPLWSVAHEMRKARSDRDAVIAFEMAAYSDLVSLPELAAYVDSTLWLRQGVQRVRDLIAKLDENAWSPMEPVMRCVWCDAGFPRPMTNRPVFDLAGRFIGTPDLVDLEAGVYGMYDGAVHLDAEVRQADVISEAAYRRLGLEGVTMMAGDLTDHGAFERRLGDAYARAERRDLADRRWMVALPEWWVPTFTVEQRRALSPYEWARYLRYRQVPDLGPTGGI